MAFSTKSTDRLADGVRDVCNNGVTARRSLAVEMAQFAAAAATSQRAWSRPRGRRRITRLSRCLACASGLVWTAPERIRALKEYTVFILIRTV
jgi:hypothetical protein